MAEINKKLKITVELEREEVEELYKALLDRKIKLKYEQEKDEKTPEYQFNANMRVKFEDLLEKHGFLYLL